MSKGSSVPYRLRQNKSVDRELFLAFLGRLAANLKLENYQYIGLGGPFLEDFRLVHSRLGLKKMICVEAEENVHKRQFFNRPTDQIECVHSKLEDYIEETDLKDPVIIWFDNTSASEIVKQIDVFTQTVLSAPPKSIIRITLNANPSSLKKPNADDKNYEGYGEQEALQKWRFDEFRKLMSGMVPHDLKPEEMTHKGYGLCILRSLNLAVQKEILKKRNLDIIWALTTHYSDGHPMITATLVTCEKDAKSIIKGIVEDWEYCSEPSSPLVLDMPALSTLERITMELHEDPSEEMEYQLPISDMGQDPFDSFKKFHRFFPHFSRVEI